MSNPTVDKPRASTTSAPTEPAKQNPPANAAGIRETVESILVAFILAFLFRAFVAEAFVIPTGSMAPTLMGAHKDTVCEHCGTLYQSTASYEFEQETQNYSDRVAIAGTCPKCRGVNSFDLAGNWNNTTFSGDRILVSKFDYLFSAPKRWDVLVFKYPSDARLNYIKRLVGLPGEQLHIEEGDVFVRKNETEPWQLARKPAHKVQAMLQVVSDTNYRATDIVSKGWPSLWQPLPPATPADTNAWQVEQTEKQWSAKLPAGNDATTTNWLRYYHKFPEESAWEAAIGGKPYAVNPTQSTLITDFLAYNTTQFGPRHLLYDEQTGLRKEITTEHRARELLDLEDRRYDGLTGLPQDGLHWVGDLAAEFDVQIKNASGVLSLDLVEFGIHYRCHIDVATGKATLIATDGDKPIDLFQNAKGEAVVPTATTSVRGAGNHRIKFANVDDQLMVWINGSLVKFDQPTEFDSQKFRKGRARRPYWTQADPLDAAPIAIGGAGTELVVTRAQVWRDIYYIAIRHSQHFCDFSDNDVDAMIASIPDQEVRRIVQADYNTLRYRIGPLNAGMDAFSWWYEHPETWDKTDLFARRGTLDFSLGPDDFFPMGDNSAASSDARAWIGHNYVERRFLIGKALLVFWPHPWMSPVPYPNFARMGLIR